MASVLIFVFCFILISTFRNQKKNQFIYKEIHINYFIACPFDSHHSFLFFFHLLFFSLFVRFSSVRLAIIFFCLILSSAVNNSICHVCLTVYLFLLN